MTGGGQYEQAVKELREKVKARGVFAMIVTPEGIADWEILIEPEEVRYLPNTLRRIAVQIEQDLQQLTSKSKPS